MLQAISALKGFAIEASDGRMGTAADFMFDDASWRVRWLVVDCGSWLKGRKVLISPSAVSYADLEDEECEVELTKAQVEDLVLFLPAYVSYPRTSKLLMITQKIFAEMEKAGEPS